MSNSYINNSIVSNCKSNYSQLNSYVLPKEDVTVVRDYILLPEEYDVFSNVESSYFSLSDTNQHRLLSMCLQYLKKQLHIIHAHYGVVRILPKLTLMTDEDNALILHWAYATFRAYLNFEKIAENSYYGIVARNTEDTIFSKTGKLTESNYVSVINMILKYVIDNS